MIFFELFCTFLKYVQLIDYLKFDLQDVYGFSRSPLHRFDALDLAKSLLLAKLCSAQIDNGDKIFDGVRSSHAEPEVNLRKHWKVTTRNEGGRRPPGAALSLIWHFYFEDAAAEMLLWLFIKLKVFAFPIVTGEVQNLHLSEKCFYAKIHHPLLRHGLPSPHFLSPCENIRYRDIR